MQALKILMVDDEPLILDAFGRLLAREGHAVTKATSGRIGLAEFANHPGETCFDVVVSDIRMPDLSGLDLLREVRKHDADVPVILMTGTPNLDTAISAIDLGVFSYLAKPLDFEKLLATIGRASRLHQLAKLKRRALELTTRDEQLLGDQASLPARLESGFRSLYVAFQPIISMRHRRLVAFEGLLRTDEPSLRNPLAFITAAERHSRVHELGRAVRGAVAAAAAALPGDLELFVNLHPLDLTDPELIAPDAPLSAIAGRVVLEITERASLDGVPDASKRIAALRKVGFRVAVDDLGAGYAGLTSLTALEPDVVKIDMTLIRGVDTDLRRQRVVGSLLELCQDLGMRVVVEGVENASERDTLVALGADLMQGYHFAKPARGFPDVLTSMWN